MGMRPAAGSGALDALAALAALDRDRRLAELRVRRQACRSLRAALSRDEAQVRQARDEAGGDPVL
ncbi:hypothetical protein, partial [Frigidibacter oleivorans]|uniref:hypothetical protein n=1 Tax=Frigidibacter oleivorans TaxID=2487129 RepID=UPI0013DEC355